MYKKGFGDPQREFWIGNEKMHLLSSQEDVKLRVELEDFEGNFSFAEYSRYSFIYNILEAKMYFAFLPNVFAELLFKMLL